MLQDNLYLQLTEYSRGSVGLRMTISWVSAHNTGFVYNCVLNFADLDVTCYKSPFSGSCIVHGMTARADVLLIIMVPSMACIVFRIVQYGGLDHLSIEASQ